MSSISAIRAQEIIATLPPSIRATPAIGEDFGQDPVAAKYRLQSYAFSCGFLIVQYRGSIKSRSISYKCAHYGDTPRPHRKTETITAS